MIIPLEQAIYEASAKLGEAYLGSVRETFRLLEETSRRLRKQRRRRGRSSFRSSTRLVLLLQMNGIGAIAGAIETNSERRWAGRGDRQRCARDPERLQRVGTATV